MKFSKADIEDCVNIRHKVLWPNLNRDALYMVGDDTAHHYGIIEDGSVVSCLSVFKLTPTHCQIRKFATLPEYQGRGCGSLLIQSVLVEIENLGFETVQLDARVTASPFYSRFGFERVGEVFNREGIEFILMKKGSSIRCE